MLNILKELKQIDEGLAKQKQLLPQTKKEVVIYAGTEENVEYFLQIANAFGIPEDSYSIKLVDGEYEILIG